MTTTDVAIIGSGAGGAPLAALLAERGRAVTLIEAGGPVAPVSVEDALERYYVNAGYLVTLGSPMIPVLVGEALGGTTAINSGTCLPPPPAVLEAWDRQCGARLADELPPHVAQVERDLGVTTPPLELLGRSHHRWMDGQRALGRPEPFILPRNAPGCAGRGVCCFGCPTGAKQSTDRCYVPRARAAGAEILSRTRAERIHETGDRVQIRVRGPDGPRDLDCRELVLAGGALGTPGLIRANRLGDRWRAAGDGLSIHPAAKVAAVFADPVHGERGVPQGMGLHIPELPTVAFEGIFTPPEALVPMLAAAGVDLPWYLDRHDRLASFGLMVTDTARGSVRRVAGQLCIRYRLAAEDARAMLAGAQYLGQAFLAAGAERVLLPFAGPGNEFCDATSLDRFDAAAVAPGRVLSAAFHPLGTAGLGRLVDDRHRLAGCDRIRVCDGAVLPGPPGVNPQITIMALASRLAALMS